MVNQSSYYASPGANGDLSAHAQKIDLPVPPDQERRAGWHSMRVAGEDTVKSARTPATAVRRMKARANMSTDIFFAWNGLKGVGYS